MDSQPMPQLREATESHNGADRPRASRPDNLGPRRRRHPRARPNGSRQFGVNQLANHATPQACEVPNVVSQEAGPSQSSAEPRFSNPKSRIRPESRYNENRNNTFRSRGNRSRPVTQPHVEKDLQDDPSNRSYNHPRGTHHRGRFRGRFNEQRPLQQTFLEENLLGNVTEPSDIIPNQSQLDINEYSHTRQPSKGTANVQSEIAESQLKSNEFECMICCDNIRRTNPIWYCNNCYNIFHLKCAIEWCNKSIKSRNEAIANAQYPSLGLAAPGQSSSRADAAQNEGYSNYKAERMNSIEWPCPTCREVLYSKPDKYKCFCGKVIRPEVDRHLTPHSCGQLCGRKRPNTDCPHTCNSVCHPGRCNICQLTSRKPCHCGKLIRDVKCSVEPSSCNDTCGKLLSCGMHTCSKICHSGSCGSCDAILTIKCKCGLEEIQRQCKEFDGRVPQSFSCERVCGKLLICGKHHCTEKCHPGPNCPDCKLLSENIKTCPCGSTSIKKSLLAERKSCTDSVPTCENKCNKPLICGPEKNRHRCQKKCHTGFCPPCKLKTVAPCECRLSSKTVPCLSMYEKIENGGQILFKQTKLSFSCETRCNTLKNCGRHRCYNKCCKYIKDSMAPIHKCGQTCNKKLPCGQHNCLETCHIGACGDCTNIGWEELTCHCGASVLYPPIPCGSLPPACHRPCRRAHDCGHSVKHECHNDTEKCAPCTVFVKKSCFCGADSKDSVHCYLPGYSCGKTCMKELVCKQHKCKRVCHDNECETTNERGLIRCKQPCPVIRFSCKHPCGLSCHGISPCPTSDCKKIIEVTCECGNKTERVECFKVMTDVDNINKVVMLSSTRTNQEGIIVDLSKKPPAKSSNISANSMKTLDCDDTCSILKRNKALAEALDIAQPDLKPSSVFGEEPLRLLKEATAQDYKFVAATFNSLARFVKSCKESDKRFVFTQFPPTNKLRREVVHELAYHFNCTSESRDEEPFRHVVVRAYKNKSCIPDFTIEQLLPVSD